MFNSPTSHLIYSMFYNQYRHFNAFYIIFNRHASFNFPTTRGTTGVAPKGPQSWASWASQLHQHGAIGNLHVVVGGAGLQRLRGVPRSPVQGLWYRCYIVA